MEKTKISATIVADSINKQGDRITTMEIVFPRFILAELNTHRMMSKNSASSRAIPFKKMIEMVENDPFIPIAWQKDHKGMQGTEYIDVDNNEICYPPSDWLEARDYIVSIVKEMNADGVTKQLCNRLLEPFMWHKVLVTATEFSNFFALRCPEYEFDGKVFKSWKDVLSYHDDAPLIQRVLKEYSDIDRRKCNKGQAEIHMTDLAEAMWDARNESTPKLLEPGEWHIPYGDNLDITDKFAWDNSTGDLIEAKIKISTGMCARVSYTTVGDEKEVSYQTLIGIHDKMLKADPFHASPFEHCAQAMTQDEYDLYVRGKLKEIDEWYIAEEPDYESTGWCRNFRGFRQYRDIIESK